MANVYCLRFCIGGDTEGGTGSEEQVKTDLVFVY